MMHDSRIGEGALIDMQSVILRSAKFGNNCFVHASAFVTGSKESPGNSLSVGPRAAPVCIFSEEDIARMRSNTANHAQCGQRFETRFKKIG